MPRNKERERGEAGRDERRDGAGPARYILARCLPPDVTATEFVTHLGRMSGLPPTLPKERWAGRSPVGLHEERYRLSALLPGMKQWVGWPRRWPATPDCRWASIHQRLVPAAA